MQRLQKVLSHAGIASRRKCEQLIRDGRVKVNGELITHLGVNVDPDLDTIEVDGEKIKLEEYVYYLFYKPTGVITSARDPQGRKVVMDYFRHVDKRIYPVGRLDYDTSGLLLLTNDGHLAYQLMHPRFEINKTYKVRVQGMPSQNKIEQLKQGIHLHDGWTFPAEVEWVRKIPQKNEAELRMTIHEGRKRQVRRMCKAIGHAVCKLHREKYSFLTLNGLQSGQHRRLSAKEVSKLKSMIVT